MHSYNLANAPTHVVVCAAQVAQAKASNFAWTPPARPEAAPKQAAPLVPTHPPPLDLVSFAGLGNAPRPHESRASRRLEVHARCLRVAPILVHVCFCVSAGVAQAASAACCGGHARGCSQLVSCSGDRRGARRQVGSTCTGPASVGPSAPRAVEQSLSAACRLRVERSARREHARC